MVVTLKELHARRDKIVANARKLTTPLIVLTQESQAVIDEWSKFSRDFHPMANSLWEHTVLKEGNLEIKAGDGISWTIYFEFLDDSANLAMFQNGVCYFFWRILRGTLDLEYTPHALDKAVANLDNVPDVAMMLTQGVCTALYFLREYSADKDLVERKEVRVPKKKKAGSKSKKKDTVTYVRRVQYTLRQSQITRAYTRQTGSWPVRGHWRKSKTGKEFWVRQHNRGTGEAKKRTYKINP